MNKMEDFFNQLAFNWDSSQIETFEQKQALIKKIKIKPGQKVIDIACGTGAITSLLYEESKCQVMGIDISPKMIEIAKDKYLENTNISFKCLDLFELNEDEKYDYAVIYNAYPHFINPKELSDKLSRILNQKGRVAIIHSLSKEGVNNCHNNISTDFSRNIGSSNEEYQFFKEHFNLLLAEEDDHSYLIILELKSPL